RSAPQSQPEGTSEERSAARQTAQITDFFNKIGPNQPFTVLADAAAASLFPAIRGTCEILLHVLGGSAGPSRLSHLQHLPAPWPAAKASAQRNLCCDAALSRYRPFAVALSGRIGTGHSLQALIRSALRLFSR
ncbi:MAG: hypothetical protein AAFQ84_12150, partial [Pseudomonadota bacterium]